MASYEALQQQLEQKKAELGRLEATLEKGREEANDLEREICNATPAEIKINNRQRDINFFFYIGMPAAALTALLFYAHGTAPAEDLLMKAKSLVFGLITWTVTATSAFGVASTYYNLKQYQR